MCQRRETFGVGRAVGVAALVAALSFAQLGCNTQTSSEAFKPPPDKNSPEVQQEMQQKIREVQNDPGVPAQAKQAYISHLSAGPAPGAMAVGPKPGGVSGK